ncbi:MAG: hypothetical protein SGI88_07780 [Candidatus Hydrogenedentes bacterium]|nr:hypothetical protein [Candidatus Hydrogenedentota bacterium]
MQNVDNVRLAGTIAEMLESFGYHKEGIYEISDLVKRHADVMENYEPALAAPEPQRPCIN